MYFYIDSKKHLISSFLPKDWMYGKCTLSYSIFKAKFAQDRDKKIWSKRMKEYFIFLFYGKIDFALKHKSIVFPSEKNEVSLQLESSPEDWYLIVFSYEKSNKGRNLYSEVKNRAYSALVNFNYGYGATYKHVISNTNDFEFNGKQQSYNYKGNFTMSPMNLELDDPNSRINEENTFKIKELLAGLINLEPNNKNRFELGLNWYLKAVSEEEVNSLISLWTAIECIAIESGTNIQPIRNILSEIYVVTKDEIESTFGIGRIFKLRSEIIHNGYLPNEISFNLLRYIGCLFIDLFYYQLNIDSERRIEQYCDKMKFSIDMELKKFDILN